MITLAFLLLTAFSLCQVQVSQKFLDDNFEMERFTAVAAALTPKELFAILINSLYGTKEGNNILKYCQNSFYPDPQDAEIFIKQFAKVSLSSQKVIERKQYPRITGEPCTYDLSDPNVFVSAANDGADVGTKALIEDLIETSFGKLVYNFSKCLGRDMLMQLIKNEKYIDQLLFFFMKEVNIGKLFDSYCSINNIFVSTSKPIQPKDPEVLKVIGERMREFIIAVEAHYERIKN